jgi:prephenate dehydrogenase
VVEPAHKLLSAADVTFIGAHPMAGREFSGFDYSIAELFRGASFITTPPEGTPETALELVEAIALKLGFGHTVRTTPEEHDRTIAFTSQLAHVVSNAYVKSPSLWDKSGFSAGSFLDLTRVAKLNEEMWASLIMLNREPMLFELRNIISHLQEYEQTLQTQDEPALRELFREGRLLKEKSLLQP